MVKLVVFYLSMGWTYIEHKKLSHTLYIPTRFGNKIKIHKFLHEFNCHPTYLSFLQLKTISALAINVNDGKCKKHMHDVYLVKDKSVCILVCIFVIDSVQLTEKH